MIAFGRRQELRPERVVLQTLLRSMTDIIIQTLGSGITLDTDYPETPATLHVDVDQLELAVINLLMNARDSMPDGGSVRIALSVHNVDSSEMIDFRLGRYICLSVADTGEGMDEATFARAMEPFFSTRGVGKGTGLGLSMVHGFAEQSGGKLVLKSRLGEGTTAEIWLPAMG
ncbi:MAG: ATP-binding protein [Rhodopila sp.]